MSRWEGSASALRLAVVASLRAVEALADAVDDGPPDTMTLAAEAQIAGRVYVGITSSTGRSPGRAQYPAAFVLHSLTLTVRGWVRRQVSDITRTVGDGTAHSYDEAWDRAELLLLTLARTTPISTSSAQVLQEGELWRVEVTAQVEWCPTVEVES
jgi:hypothetical protein